MLSAGLLARGSAPPSTFPAVRPVACRRRLSAYSCGGSRGIGPGRSDPARTAFPFHLGVIRGTESEANEHAQSACGKPASPEGGGIETFRPQRGEPHGDQAFVAAAGMLALNVVPEVGRALPTLRHAEERPQAASRSTAPGLHSCPACFETPPGRCLGLLILPDCACPSLRKPGSSRPDGWAPTIAGVWTGVCRPSVLEGAVIPAQRDAVSPRMAARSNGSRTTELSNTVVLMPVSKS